MTKDELKALIKVVQEKAAAKEDLSPAETAILVLASRWNPANTYCDLDRVRRVAAISAGPLKLAAYTVADPETFEHGKVQFHMTWDNTVIGLMSEESAKMFAMFVCRTLNVSCSGDGAKTPQPKSGSFT